MSDTTTWTAISEVIEVLGSTVNLKSRIAAKAGMVAAFAATGVSGQVEPAVSGTTGPVVGVYVNDVAAGKMAVIGTYGTVIKVQEGAGSALDAGDWVAADDAAATGCVKALDTTTTNYDRVGMLLDDLAGNGTARCLVSPGVTTKAAS
jgi:hypothetical protein